MRKVNNNGSSSLLSISTTEKAASEKLSFIGPLFPLLSIYRATSNVKFHTYMTLIQLLAYIV